MTVLIHIGTHKTGSTSLQQFCVRAADQLNDDGILYPESGRPTDHDPPWGHHVLAWSIQNKHGWTGLEGWKTVKDEVASSDVSCVLLSSEGFVTCSVDQIRRIRSFFPDAEVRVLVYLREPFSHMLSVYKQYVTTWGETRSFQKFADAKMHLCDYPALIDRWRQGLGSGRILTRSFEQCCSRSKGLEASLLEVLGLELGHYESFITGPTNVSPENYQAAAVRWMNRLQEYFGAGTLGDSGLLLDRSIVHRVKRQVIRGTRSGRFLARLLNGTLAGPLYSDTDREWFTDRLQEEQGSSECVSDIVGASF